MTGIVLTQRKCLTNERMYTYMYMYAHVHLHMHKVTGQEEEEQLITGMQRLTSCSEDDCEDARPGICFASM